MSKMSCKTEWLSRHSDERAGANADQAEFDAIVYGATILESGLMDDRIAGAMEDYEINDPGGIESWAKEDATIESATSSIGREIARRNTVVGKSYPFTISGNRLEYAPSSTGAYEFCLAISQSPSITKGDFSKLPRAFERLSRDVMKCFLHCGADGMRIGWPPDKEDPHPARLKSIFDKLRTTIQAQTDFTWNPSYGHPDDPSSVHVKDLGVDFIVWKLIPDGRDGHLFLLGQCACGKDWEQKFYDLTKEKLEGWLNPISAASFIRVFTTPHHIPNNTYFTDVTRRAGLTLDRARIARFAESQYFIQHLVPQMEDSLIDLTSLVIKRS